MQIPLGKKFDQGIRNGREEVPFKIKDNNFRWLEKIYSG